MWEGRVGNGDGSGGGRCYDRGHVRMRMEEKKEEDKKVRKEGTEGETDRE